MYLYIYIYIIYIYIYIYKRIYTHKLRSTTRNKISNYKDTVNSIHVEDEISFTSNIDPCECENCLCETLNFRNC